MDKRVMADSVRVINEEIHDFLPAINTLEPELPKPLLENVARNYNIKDILRSFLGNAIPLKPQEFTRIILIQKGLPEEAFDPVLEGVLKAKPEGAINTKSGVVRSKISDMLLPFLASRSSFISPVVSKLMRIFSPLGIEKTSAAYYQPNPVMEALDQNPAMNFGYVRRVPEYQNLNGRYPENTIFVNHFNGNYLEQLPMAFSPEAYEQEIRRPSLSVSDKNKLIALGAIAGKDYAAYKKPEVVLSALREPDLLSSLALALAALNGVKDSFSMTSPTQQTKKVASMEDPLDDILVEHLVNSFNPESIAVIDSLEKGASIKDGSVSLVKNASVKNNMIDAAETVLLPLYIVRKSASPLNLATSLITDSSLVNKIL